MSEDAAGAAAALPDIRVLGGNPDAEELAAITAVIVSAVNEYAASARQVEALGQSGVWRRGQLRGPLPRNQWRWSGWT